MFAAKRARHVNLLSAHVVAMLVGLDPTVVLVFVKLVNIIQHFFTQGRTQWLTPPRFDPRFLLFFHKIVRLTATGL